MSASYSLDGRRIVTASADRTARVWDAEKGRLLAELKGHGHSVSSAAFSPDGLRIVTASYDRTVRVWEADGGLLLAELKGHGGRVFGAAIGPDGRSVVTASWDHTARVWDLSPEARTHEQLAKLIRRHVPAKFEREGSNIIVHRMPPPGD